jgi:LPXTG-site transpeptidase (sortase) family protein
MSESRKELRRKRKQANNARYFRYIAAVLIIAGLAVVGFAGYQKIKFNYNQAALRSDYETTAGFAHLNLEKKPETVIISEWKPIRLIIPKINVDLITLYGDVYDRSLLEKGPVHFADIALSDNRYLAGDLPSTEGGNVAFAGHRRDNIFIDIDQLVKGDEIYLDVDGYRFIYLVEWQKVVDKYSWDELLTTDYSALTLQTCEPKYAINPYYRMYVRGALDQVIIIPDETAEAD